MDNNIKSKIENLVDRSYESIFGDELEIIKNANEKLRKTNERDSFIVTELIRMRRDSLKIIKAREGKENLTDDEKKFLEYEHGICYVCERILYLFGVDTDKL